MCGSPRMSIAFDGPDRAIITTSKGSREFVPASNNPDTRREPGPGVSRLVALLEDGIELLSGEHPIEDYGAWKAEAREAIEDNRPEEDRMTGVVADIIERFLIKKETEKGHELLKVLRELSPVVTYPGGFVRLSCESEDGDLRIHDALSDFISAVDEPVAE
jgi:hypothetical protein